MKISVTIEGMAGLTWPRWKRLVNAIEQLGFAGLFRSDHFTLTSPPDLDSLEMVVSLTYLATHSQRVHFGSLVAPLTFRDPIMLARQAMAIDDLSDGRMILGVGAGWLEREHTMFGYTLADTATRLTRLEEGLEVITKLTRSSEPVNFNGRFYQLQEAHLLPRPQRATPIMVGGNGPKRTLPLVARFADIWNCFGVTPEVFGERSALLDLLIHRNGREPSDVKRTMMLTVICWRDAGDRERRMAPLRGIGAPFSGMSNDDIVGMMKNNMAGILGTPENVIEQMRAYASAGAEELMIAWWSLDDIEGLEVLAEQVMPYVAA
jgi:alkanesulfonate monooxygenase SsuD/methylene tetrahydromethanopterin reductase-like flavin-dependent oxidoreductase (luciferase family)